MGGKVDVVRAASSVSRSEEEINRAEAGSSKSREDPPSQTEGRAPAVDLYGVSVIAAFKDQFAGDQAGAPRVFFVAVLAAVSVNFFL
jgi:hypothetical protein